MCYCVTNSQGSITTLVKQDGTLAAYYRYSPYGQPTIVVDDDNAAASNP